jgi:hypothetical protein
MNRINTTTFVQELSKSLIGELIIPSESDDELVSIWVEGGSRRYLE